MIIINIWDHFLEVTLVDLLFWLNCWAVFWPELGRYCSCYPPPWLVVGGFTLSSNSYRNNSYIGTRIIKQCKVTETRYNNTVKTSVKSCGAALASRMSRLSLDVNYDKKKGLKFKFYDTHTRIFNYCLVRKENKYYFNKKYNKIKELF